MTEDGLIICLCQSMEAGRVPRVESYYRRNHLGRFHSVSLYKWHFNQENNVDAKPVTIFL